jgi:Flp pilus assembly protein TadB
MCSDSMLINEQRKKRVLLAVPVAMVAVVAVVAVVVVVAGVAVVVVVAGVAVVRVRVGRAPGVRVPRVFVLLPKQPRQPWAGRRAPLSSARV